MMVIDCAKGVESRTIKLMEVCRLRDTPIITFVNKLDREGREPIEILDEIESILKINCVPITWPIGMGSNLRGIYHIGEDKIYIYNKKINNSEESETKIIESIRSDEAQEFLGADAENFHEESI